MAFSRGGEHLLGRHVRNEYRAVVCTGASSLPDMPLGQTDREVGADTVPEVQRLEMIGI